jgi:pimeloyl-ACP methyl ester carboxylesterase
MNEKAKWRDPALGQRGRIDLPPGRIEYFQSGSGPTLVFVHGGFVNANLWRKLVPLLEAEFQCVVLDLPFGSHAIPMNPGADLGERGSVDLIVDAIEALGLEDVTLIGMDTGGAICQFIVTQRPERISRLVLTSCDYRDNFPPRIFSYLKILPALAPLAPLLFAPIRMRAPRRLPFALGRLSYTKIDGRVTDTYSLPTLIDRHILNDTMSFLRIFDKRRLNATADQLRSFKKPALIAWSREDKVFPAEHGERLAQELPNSRLVWIDGALTFSMEDQPEQLATTITEFVRETAPTVAA